MKEKQKELSNKTKITSKGVSTWCFLLGLARTKTKWYKFTALVKNKSNDRKDERKNDSLRTRLSSK